MAADVTARPGVKPTTLKSQKSVEPCLGDSLSHSVHHTSGLFIVLISEGRFSVCWRQLNVESSDVRGAAVRTLRASLSSTPCGTTGLDLSSVYGEISEEQALTLSWITNDNNMS